MISSTTLLLTRLRQIWREHTTSDGRKYWYNTLTRQSTWEKPAELLTPEEKALMNCPWKEYKTPDGKTYYSNIQTKESKWVMPDEYKGKDSLPGLVRWILITQ